jgi:hypothetical protein
MKLYVCWGTFQTPRPGGHPCGNAYDALKQAGYQPEVIKAHSFGPFPNFMQTKTRRMLEQKTGSTWVPVLETDDGEWINESKDIVAWAEKHPAPVPAS